MTRALVLLSICLSCCPAAVVIRMACGGSGGTDQAGRLWTPDASYSGGTPWTSPILSGMEKPYGAMRSSSTPGASFTYNLQILPGTYTVTLKFLEPRIDQAAGQRLLNIAINGSPVLANLDLLAVSGALTPYDVSFPVTAAAGRIQIVVGAAKGNAVLSGIEIDAPDIAPPVNIMSRVFIWDSANAFMADGESEMCYPQSLGATVIGAKLIAQKPTDVAMDVLVVPFNDYFDDDHVFSIVAGDPLALVNSRKTSVTTAAWKPIPKDSVLCLRLTSPLNVVWVAAELLLQLAPLP